LAISRSQVKIQNLLSTLHKNVENHFQRGRGGGREEWKGRGAKKGLGAGKWRDNTAISESFSRLFLSARET